MTKCTCKNREGDDYYCRQHGGNGSWIDRKVRKEMAARRRDALRKLVPEAPLPDFVNKREYAAILLYFAAEDEEVWGHLSQMIGALNAKRHIRPTMQIERTVDST